MGRGVGVGELTVLFPVRPVRPLSSWPSRLHPEDQTASLQPASQLKTHTHCTIDDVLTVLFLSPRVAIVIVWLNTHTKKWLSMYSANQYTDIAMIYKHAHTHIPTHTCMHTHTHTHTHIHTMMHTIWRHTNMMRKLTTDVSWNEGTAKTGCQMSK